MRNGDFVPSRLQAQQEAVSLVCHAKLRSNPENNVALLTMAGIPQVLTALTTDVGRVLSKLHQVRVDGNANLLTGIKIAHLALKHRQGKNHKMRIVAFIGSPVETEEKELIKIAKKLKKEKVNVDIVNFGEEVSNTSKLRAFIKILDGTASHMVTVPPGSMLSDVLYSSPIIVGEDGASAVGLSAPGFEFGVDPNEDPELALALRVSMEEQRQRQEEEARQASASSNANTSQGNSTNAPTTATPANASTPTTPINTSTDDVLKVPDRPATGTEEEMLERALAMSLEPNASASSDSLDISRMTEEQQIQYAMQMSLQASSTGKDQQSPQPSVKGTDDSNASMKKDESKDEPMDTDDSNDKKN